MTDTWAMGCTLRWHSSPWWALRMSGDTVDAHNSRMNRGAKQHLGFWSKGDRLDLSDAIQIHDLPEIFTGDWSSPNKAEIPGLRPALQAVDEVVFKHMGFHDLPPMIAMALEWFDRWDGLRWAQHVEPRAVMSGGFPEVVKMLDQQSWRLGIADSYTAERRAA